MRGRTSENSYGNEFGTRATVSTDFAIVVSLMDRWNIQTFAEIIVYSFSRCDWRDLQRNDNAFRQAELRDILIKKGKQSGNVRRVDIEHSPVTSLLYV